MKITKWIANANYSAWDRWKLNFVLQRYIPFNRPHRLQVINIGDNAVQVKLPYRKSNLNHIKGLHACGLATAAEYASGLLLLHKLGMKKYRIIMESIQVEYKYQGKSDGIATFEIKEEEFEKEVLQPLEQEGKVYRKCRIEVHDEAANLLCIAYTNWQIKDWSKVQTKRE